MKQLFILLAVIISVLSHAQDTTKVLFIGNSFTSQNNLPAVFSQLVQSSGKNVVVASHMPGGVSVGDISQGSSAHMNNPLVYSLIKSNDWDYLVLQDNQGRFCLGYGQFPSSSLVIEGHMKIRDSLLFHHPCAHVIWFAGFGPKNGYPPYGNTGEALIDSIYHNYQFLVDTAGQIIAPIGPAFKRIISGAASINLWSSDDVHPSLYGTSLVANVLYSTIYKSSPIHSSYNPGFSTYEDSLLKTTAYQTTIDSLKYSGLSEITPVINQVGNTLSVSGYQNCNWFFNGNPYLSNNCIANINQPGNYYALITDMNNCELRTLEYYYLTTDVVDIINSKNDIYLYPSPASDFIFINISNLSDIGGELRIYDATACLVKTEVLKQNKQKINTDDLSVGLYLVVVKSERISKTLKLIIQR